MWKPEFVTYEVAGEKFVLRKFTSRDLVRINGALPLFSMDEKAPAQNVAQLLRGMDATDRLLVLCGVNPKFVTEVSEDLPDGVVPVSMLPDDVYKEIVARLSKDSGYSAEAADEVRPSSGTVAVS